jgi:ABC-type multidrug transport system ATPase subunit
LHAIEVDGLTKTYPGGVEAVKALHFDVAPGEVFGLLGPNGAGKSTTVGMLMTTVAPTAGSARLAGFDVARQSLAARRVSSVVFQEPVVDRALTGRAHLELHARLWGVTRARADAATAELVEALGLSELVDVPSARIAAASAGAWRSRARSPPSRACSSSTSPRWGSIRASATSCSTLSPACVCAAR